MPTSPIEFTLELTPRARIDVIDVRGIIASKFGDALDPYPRALCCSFHTTAGYLDRGVAARLGQNRHDVTPYIDVFRTMFPEGAGYEHDKVDRRTELTAEQRPREQPRMEQRREQPRMEQPHSRPPPQERHSPPPRQSAPEPRPQPRESRQQDGNRAQRR